MSTERFTHWDFVDYQPFEITRLQHYYRNMILPELNTGTRLELDIANKIECVFLHNPASICIYSICTSYATTISQNVNSQNFLKIVIFYKFIFLSLLYT